MRANAVNLASFANALCHFNATPLSVAVLVGEADKAKMGQCLGGGLLSLSLSLSLVARAFWHTFGLNLKGFFTHFIVVLTHLFTYKRHFLGHCAFLKFLNALFVRFCALFVILSLCKKAKNPKNLRYALFMDTSLTLSMTNSDFYLKMTDKSHNFAHQKHFFVQSLGTKFTNFTRFYGLPRSLCSLAMTARQKFKFFTQNSKHFVNSNHLINSKHFTNSTHFINLSQILSHTQGFFISLPQIFEQFLLINLIERRSYGSSWHKRQDKNSRAD